MVFLQKNGIEMGIIGIIKHQMESFYRHRIVCEQYPMLTSLSRKEWGYQGASGLVYMLHHVTEKNPNGIPTNEDLKVSPAFLEKIILAYQAKGFSFISLDELSVILSSSQKHKRPFIAFTIDDGYLDNYTHALPIFERHQVPFAIFVAIDFIDQKAVLWWDVLEELVLHNDIIHYNKQSFPCHTFQEKWDTFRIIREDILKYDQSQLIESLQKAFHNYHIDWLKPIREKAMTWDQIKELSQHPLCTIGGHTVSHPALNQLSDDDFRQEVRVGIEKLESVTGQKINHFAYPYGSPNEIDEREYRLINEFNFKTSFIAYGGCITEKNKNNITHLPRVYLHER